jgi:uncharacterized protein (UPF0128 family)
MISMNKSKVLEYLSTKSKPYEIYKFSNGEMLIIRFKGKNELDALVKGLKSIGVDVNDNDFVIASDRIMLWFRYDNMNKQ